MGVGYGIEECRSSENHTSTKCLSAWHQSAHALKDQATSEPSCVLLCDNK